MALRKHLPYGYVAYTGKRLCNAHIDTYNRIQDDINTWIKDGRNVPDWLLDWSHRYFASVATV